jgi:serine/threonine protein kinase
MPNHFLAAGVYGCVYYPGYSCKGNPMKKKKWVSKLTYRNEKTTAEIEIGERLKKVPHYEDHFVLVERACPIPYKSLTSMKEGCDLIKKEKPYVLLYSRYVPSMELYQYLQKNTLVVRAIRCFFQVCDSIEILVSQKIVHHDLHFANQLYSTETSKLLVIDFGLAMNAERFDNHDYLKEVFSRYMPEWNWYALEIHMLCYLLHHGPLTEKVVYHAIDKYLEKHVVFKLFPLVRNQFRKDAEQVYLSMIEWTREECIEQLLQYWNTWDYYETALRFLYLYSENQMTYPAYLDHLLSMIHADPEKRPNVLEIRKTNKKVIQAFNMANVHSSYSSIDEDVATQTIEKN